MTRQELAIRHKVGRRNHDWKIEIEESWLLRWLPILHPTTFAVWCVLLKYVNRGTMTCYVSWQTLHLWTGFNLDSLQLAQNELIKYKLVSIELKPGRKTVYTLRPEAEPPEGAARGQWRQVIHANGLGYVGAPTWLSRITLNPPEQLPGVPPEQLPGVPPEQLPGVRGEQLPGVPPRATPPPQTPPLTPPPNNFPNLVPETVSPVGGVDSSEEEAPPPPALGPPPREPKQQPGENLVQFADRYRDWQEEMREYQVEKRRRDEARPLPKREEALILLEMCERYQLAPDLPGAMRIIDSCRRFRHNVTIHEICRAITDRLIARGLKLQHGSDGRVYAQEKPHGLDNPFGFLIACIPSMFQT